MADEPGDAFQIAHFRIRVHAAQPRFQAGNRLVGRRKELHRLIHLTDQPVGSSAFSGDIETAAEGSAGLQHPENLPIGSLLVREGVKAVEGQDNIECAVLVGKRPYVALPEGNVGEVQPLRLFPRLPHHVRGVVQAGDLRMGKRLVDGHGQDSRPHRNLQQLTGKILRNAGQGFFQIVVALRLVHVPHQTAYRLSPERGAGDHTVVKIAAACHAVGIADGVLSFHFLILDF